ncbi:MAG: translocation/assembly module TamB domain-containing protein [Deltaproteobacteria bacterium]|nr:translocation/assembly module TamB domain-containing protein [Deltaproteobacteria bacterium]
MGLALVLATVALLAGSWQGLKTRSGQALLHRALLAQLKERIPGLQVGYLGGDLPAELLLGQVRVLDAYGREALGADWVAARLDLSGVLRKVVRIERLVLVRPRVLAYPVLGGRFNLEELVVPGPAPSTPSTWSVELGDVRLARGELDLTYGIQRGQTVRLRELSALGWLRVRGGDLDGELRSLSVRGEAAGRRFQLATSLSARLGAVAMKVTGQAQVRELLPGGAVSVRFEADGPFDRLVCRAGVASPALGAVTVDGLLRLPKGRPWSYAVTTRLERLHPGVLVPALRSSELTAVLTAKGEGTPLDPRARASAVLEVVRAKLAEWEVSTGRVDATLVGDRWTVRDGALTVAGVKVGLRGTGQGPQVEGSLKAAIAPGSARPGPLAALRGRWRLEAGVSGRLPDGLKGQAELSAHEASVAGHRVGSLRLRAEVRGSRDSPSGTLRAEVRGLRPAGSELRLDRVRVGAAGGLTGGRVTVDAEGHDARVTVKGNLQRRGSAWHLGLVELRGRRERLELALTRPVALEWRKGTLSILRPFVLRGRGGELELEGRFTPGTQERVAGLLAIARGLRLPRLGAVTGQLKLELLRRATELNLNVALGRGAGGTSASVTGRLPFGWRSGLRRDVPLALDGQLRRVSLAWLSYLGGRPGWMTGALDARVQLSGTLEAPAALVRLETERVVAGPWELARSGLEVEGDARGVRVRLESRLPTGAGVHLRGAAGLPLAALLRQSGLALAPRGRERLPPLEATPVELALEVKEVPAALLRQLVPSLAPLEGRLGASVSLRGPISACALALRARLEGGRWDGVSLGDFGLRADGQLGPARTRLTGAASWNGRETLAFGGSTATGLLGLRAALASRRAALNGQVTVTDLDLARLAAARLLPAGVQGRLAAQAWFNGSWSAPRLQAALRLRDPGVTQARLREVEAHVRLDDRGLAVKARALQGAGGQLYLVGRHALRAGAAVDGELQVNRMQLAPLKALVPEVQRLQGELSGALRLKGSFDRPLLSGGLTLTRGAAGVLGRPVLDGIQAQLSLVPGELRLLRLRIPEGDRSLEVTARLKLAGLRPEHLTLKLLSKRFPLVYVGVPNASFEGALEGALAFGERGLEGTVRSRGGLIRMPTLPGARRALHRLGDLPEVRFTEGRLLDRGGVLLPVARRSSSPALSLAIDVRGLAITGKELTGQLETRLRLRHGGGNPLLLEGDAALVDGRITLLKRAYEVRRARVNFDGSPELDPGLDVRLTRQFPEALLILDLGGTLAEPRLELSSDPAVYDRGQLISLVLSGQAGGASGAAGSGSTLALAGILMQLAVGNLADRIVPGVAPDVVRIDTVQGAAGGATGERTKLEVGKYLGDRVYVGYRRIIGAVEGENRNEGRLELRFLSRWAFEAAFGDAAVGGLDLFWTYWY